MSILKQFKPDDSYFGVPVFYISEYEFNSYVNEFGLVNTIHFRTWDELIYKTNPNHPGVEMAQFRNYRILVIESGRCQVFTKAGNK